MTTKLSSDEMNMITRLVHGIVERQRHLPLSDEVFADYIVHSIDANLRAGVPND